MNSYTNQDHRLRSYSDKTSLTLGLSYSNSEGTLKTLNDLNDYPKRP